MTWLYLLGAWALTDVALAGAVWYYRSRFQSAVAALLTLQAADAGQVALDLTLAAQVVKAREGLAARQKAEAHDDALVAQAASVDPAAAAALLNRLHPDHVSSGASAADPVPAAAGPAVPRPSR